MADSRIHDGSKIVDISKYFEDTSFVTGDSPATLDLTAALGRNANGFLIINDGPGNFTYAFSIDGSNFGDEITMKNNEWKLYSNMSIDSVRITWVADSAFRVEAL